MTSKFEATKTIGLFDHE